MGSFLERIMVQRVNKRSTLLKCQYIQKEIQAPKISICDLLEKNLSITVVILRNKSTLGTTKPYKTRFLLNELMYSEIPVQRTKIYSEIWYNEPLCSEIPIQ